VGYLIKRAQAALRAEMDGALAACELTTPQYAALAALEHEPGLSNAELARRCFVTPQTMIRIVEGLEERGALTRHEHPTHGRILEVRLTADGRRAIAGGHQRVAAIERRMLRALSESERRVLAELLERCAAAFDEE